MEKVHIALLGLVLHSFVAGLWGGDLFKKALKKQVDKETLMAVVVCTLGTIILYAYIAFNYE